MNLQLEIFAEKCKLLTYVSHTKFEFKPSWIVVVYTRCPMYTTKNAGSRFRPNAPPGGICVLLWRTCIDMSPYYSTTRFSLLPRIGKQWLNFIHLLFRPKFNDIPIWSQIYISKGETWFILPMWSITSLFTQRNFFESKLLYNVHVYRIGGHIYIDQNSSTYRCKNRLFF